MEMSIAYRFRTKIQKNGDIQRDKGRYRKNTASVMPAEGYRNYFCRSVPGPYPYAHKYTAEVQCIADNGVSKGKEQLNDIRQARKSQIQVW